MKLDNPDHPRFLTEALREIAVNARNEEIRYRHAAQLQANLAEACVVIASHMDIAASVTDPDRSQALRGGVAGAVLVSAVEEMRAKATEAKAREEYEAFDLYDDALFLLENAYERAQNDIAHTNGRMS